MMNAGQVPGGPAFDVGRFDIRKKPMAEDQNTKTPKTQKQASRKRAKFPTKQGKSKVGYGIPPEEYQFKPGQSGNPKGPPKHRVQLWTYISRYMSMTESALNKLQPEKLTCTQRWALRIGKSTKKLSFSTLDRFARYVINRDEGRPTERMLIQEDQNALTDEQCEEMRQTLRRNLEEPNIQARVPK